MQRMAVHCLPDVCHRSVMNLQRFHKNRKAGPIAGPLRAVTAGLDAAVLAPRPVPNPAGIVCPVGIPPRLRYARGGSKGQGRR